MVDPSPTVRVILLKYKLGLNTTVQRDFKMRHLNKCKQILNSLFTSHHFHLFITSSWASLLYPGPSSNPTVPQVLCLSFSPCLTSLPTIFHEFFPLNLLCFSPNILLTFGKSHVFFFFLTSLLPKI